MNLRKLTVLALVVGLGGMLVGASAQVPKRTTGIGHGVPAAGGGAAGEGVHIRRIEGVGKQYTVKTPEFTTSHQAGTKRPADWGEIRLIFDTTPEWIDELSVQYFVLTLTKDKGKNLYSFYKTTVRYGDIAGGSGHMVAVYLPPAAVKRYGSPVAVAAEITVADKVVDTRSESGGLKLPDKWWQDPSVLGKDNVSIRNEYLVSKGHSPFALINIDDYEAER